MSKKAFELNLTMKYLVGLMIAMVIYVAQTNWVTVAAFNKETGEIKTRVTVVEQRLEHVPSKSDFSALLSSSKRIESLLEKQRK